MGPISADDYARILISKFEERRTSGKPVVLPDYLLEGAEQWQTAGAFPDGLMSATVRQKMTESVAGLTTKVNAEKAAPVTAVVIIVFVLIVLYFIFGH
jgi:hypothetical protein